MSLSEEYKKTVSDNPYMLQIGETPEQYNIRAEGLRSKPTNQPTIGSLGLDTGSSPYEQEIERLQNERFSNLNEPAPTREGVRKEITDMFQDQIDALNRAAAEEKARLSTRYAEIGKRRLGTERAQQAGSGMLVVLYNSLTANSGTINTAGGAGGAGGTAYTRTGVVGNNAGGQCSGGGGGGGAYAGDYAPHTGANGGTAGATDSVLIAQNNFF